MSGIRRWWPAAALVTVATLAVVVMARPGPLPGEVTYVRWLQARGGPVPAAAEWIRLVTSTEAALVAGLVPAVAMLRRSGRAALPVLAIVLATMLVVQPLLKEIVDRPRPDTTMVEVRAEHSSMSFPSGHSMSTTVTWGTVGGVLLAGGRRRLAAVAVVPVVATFLSSGVQGVHWPTDAVAGTLLGAVAAQLAVRRCTSARGGDRSSCEP